MVGWLDGWIAGVVYRWKKSVIKEGNPFTDIALWFSLEDKLDAINYHKFG